MDSSPTVRRLATATNASPTRRSTVSATMHFPNSRDGLSTSIEIKINDNNNRMGKKRSESESASSDIGSESLFTSMNDFSSIEVIKTLSDSWPKTTTTTTTIPSSISSSSSEYCGSSTSTPPQSPPVSRAFTHSTSASSLISESTSRTSSPLRTSLTSTKPATPVKPSIDNAGISIPNFRDIGGYVCYPTSYCSAKPLGYLRKGVVFRTSSVHRANEKDVSIIIDQLKIQTLIDLRHGEDSMKLGSLQPYFKTIQLGHIRTPKPRRRLSTSFGSDDKKISDENGSVRICYGISLVSLEFSLQVAQNLPMGAMLQAAEAYFRGGEDAKLKAKQICASAALNPIGLEGLYQLFIDSCGKEICNILKIIAGPENLPLVIYCHHGKDRTGIVIALLLATCGVPREEIVSNYSISHEMLEPLHEQVRQDMKNAGCDPDLFAHTPQETMIFLLEYIDEKYGSVYEFLSKIGFTREWQQKLRRTLVVPASAPRATIVANNLIPKLPISRVLSKKIDDDDYSKSPKVNKSKSPHIVVNDHSQKDKDKRDEKTKK